MRQMLPNTWYFENGRRATANHSPARNMTKLTIVVAIPAPNRPSGGSTHTP